MFRFLLILGLMFAWPLAPVRAKEAASAPALTRAQREHQRDLLLRYGARLAAVNDKHRVFRRLCDVASQEQLEALDRLRISPSQLRSLLRVLQDNLPKQGPNEDEFKELKRKLQPKFEEILGSEQFDLLLELVPSPQQIENLESILADAAASPEGRMAWEAATELKAGLTPEQQQWLEPFLNLARPAEGQGQPAAPEAGPSDPTASPAPERRLVLLKRTSLGDYYADASPDLDHGLYLRRRYRVEGGDPAVLSAVSSETGLPVRLLGTYEGDVLRLAPTRLVGLPPILAVPGGNRVWRGRLPARVLAVSPPSIELDAGRGQRITARLDFQNGTEQQQFEKAAAAETFLVGATCLVEPEQATLVDVDFGPWQPPQAGLEASCLLQLSEEFLIHAAREYLAGHRDQLASGESAGQVSFRVDDLGLTLRGCQEHQVRLYGTASLAHSGLNVLEGEFEVLAQAEFVNRGLQLKPVPGSLQLRVTFPLFAPVPESWIKTLEQTLGAEYAGGSHLALPGQVWDSLLSSGLLEEGQLDQLKLLTLPSGDRRISLLAVTAPARSAGAPDPLHSRIEAPAEYALAFSDEAVTAALRRKVPELLPIQRKIPPHLQENEGVRLTDLEIPELDLSFAQGLFQINHCVVNVHWTWGLFSGVEPGIRFKGTARVTGSGNPLKLAANLQVESLEFLSSMLLEKTPEEQQQLKDKLIKVLQENAVDLPEPGPLAATLLSSRASFLLTAVKGSPTPSELLLQGQLKP